MSVPTAPPPPTEPAKDFMEIVHPRDRACEDAGKELLGFINSWALKYDLTELEFLHLILVPQQRLLQKMNERARLTSGT